MKGFEPSTPVWKTGVLPLTLHPRRPERDRTFLYPRIRRARYRYATGQYTQEDLNPQHIGCKPTALPLSYECISLVGRSQTLRPRTRHLPRFRPGKMEPMEGFEPPPDDYGTPTLPLRHTGPEPKEGIEPSPTSYQEVVLPLAPRWRKPSCLQAPST